MMLPSVNRIKLKIRIDEVMKEGKLLQSDNFGIAALKKVEDTPKFAFVISTKISKLAVHRNRINRAFNEGVRRVLSEIPEKYDYVFLAKKSISSRSTDDIIKEVISFYSQIKL